jgi:hypothetical protein
MGPVPLNVKNFLHSSQFGRFRSNKKSNVLTRGLPICVLLFVCVSRLYLMLVIPETRRAH